MDVGKITPMNIANQIKGDAAELEERNRQLSQDLNDFTMKNSKSMLVVNMDSNRRTNDAQVISEITKSMKQISEQISMKL